MLKGSHHSHPQAQSLRKHCKVNLAPKWGSLQLFSAVCIDSTANPRRADVFVFCPLLQDRLCQPLPCEPSLTLRKNNLCHSMLPGTFPMVSPSHVMGLQARFNLYHPLHQTTVGATQSTSSPHSHKKVHDIYTKCTYDTHNKRQLLFSCCMCISSHRAGYTCAIPSYSLICTCNLIVCSEVIFFFPQKMPVFQMGGNTSTQVSSKDLGGKKIPQILGVYSADIAV